MTPYASMVLHRLEAQIQANIALSLDEMTPTRKARPRAEVMELLCTLRRRNNPLRRELNRLQQAVLADPID